MTLKQARTERGFTQEELASLVGVTNITISLLEKNKVVASKRTRYRLNKIFGSDKIDFYVRQSSLINMIADFVGSDVKRADQLKAHINKVVEVNTLNIRNFSKTKNKKSK